MICARWGRTQRSHRTIIAEGISPASKANCDTMRSKYHSTPAMLGGLLLSLMLTPAHPAVAQMPGVPVLQNAFANPGFTAAADLGSGGGVSTFGGAGAFAAASGRLQFSGGIGLFTPNNGVGRFAYGLRAFAPLIGAGDSKFGFGVFAGIGGAASGHATTAAGADTTSSASVTQVPLGASIAYRMAVGSSHGFSIYGSPVFTWYNKGASGAGTGSVFRATVGTDVGITPNIGLTIGLEFGASADDGTNGPQGTLFGAGLSYACGRR